MYIVTPKSHDKAIPLLNFECQVIFASPCILPTKRGNLKNRLSAMWKEVAVTYFKVLSQVLVIAEKKCQNFSWNLPYRARNFNLAHNLQNKRDNFAEPKSCSVSRCRTHLEVTYLIKLQITKFIQRRRYVNEHGYLLG